MLEIAIVVAAFAAWTAGGLVYGEILVRRDRAAVMAPVAYSPDEARVASILALMLWPVYAVIDIVSAFQAAKRHLLGAGRPKSTLGQTLDRPHHSTRG